MAREAARVRERIGLTGQFASVDEILTGTQNLVMSGRLLDMSRRDATARARELLAWFDLSEAADRAAKTYSGGMRRRLDLAASLVGRPAVIFLDEPTTGLDPSKREDMWGVIRSLVAEGSTVLLTTQYLEEADALADDITVFDHGRVIARHTPDGRKRIVGGQTLAVRPADPAHLPEVAALLGAVAGMRPDAPVQGSLSAPVRDDTALTQLVAGLAERGSGDRAVAEGAEPRRGVLLAHRPWLRSTSPRAHPGGGGIRTARHSLALARRSLDQTR
jgi:oleandomycin transport system ATP-binding protein